MMSKEKCCEKDCETTLCSDKRDEFERLTRPLIKFLNDNLHPHASILISTDHAELVEGITAYTTDDYIGD